MIELDRTTARRFLLAYHFLLPPRSLKRTDVMTIAHRLRAIQVDPLDIVGRNVFLVMQSRIKGFVPHDLDAEVYEQRVLTEAWDKMRCLVLREEWWGLAPFREAFRRRWQRLHVPPEEVLDYVRSEIAQRGSATSLDLESKGSTDWRWSATSAARAALELLFDVGELAISGRDKGRKIYSAIEQAVPDDKRAHRHASEQAYFTWHMERRVRSLGIAVQRAGQAWLGIAGAKSADRSAALGELEERGVIEQARIEGIDRPCFLPDDARALLSGDPVAHRSTGQAAAFLAPLDNVLWDRQLIEELFEFSYTWEVYKPAAKREFGYYVLPVLYGDELVARWEPRRTESALSCRGWWWEPPVQKKRDDDELKAAVGIAVREFMAFLERDRFAVESSVTRADARFLRSAVRVAGSESS